MSLPPTYRPVDDPRAEQAKIFDPALKQYANAFRPADPSFADPDLSAAWYAARRRAMDLVLAAIAGSPWREALVLRGSVVLRAWYGEAAREPGDLDFVVVPREWGVTEPRTGAMLDGIAAAAEARSGDGIGFTAARAVTGEIWTYERVPGRRLVLPWAAEGLPGGAAQLDFVFNEPLPVPAEPVLVAPGARLNAATRELSLAWKLLWLVTDSYPQGKDLYDAVLLAESAPLRYGVLRDAFLPGEAYYAEHPVRPETLTGLEPEVGRDWEYFEREYPKLATDPQSMLRRLAAALAPTFAEVEPAAVDAWWRAGWVERVRELLATEGSDAAQRWLAAADPSFRLAHELLREALAEPDAPALAERMPAGPWWEYWAGQVRKGARTVQELIARG
ncbi:nucleotidyl transferase AbiEii/AbiGii toxin family protein [Kitasatospora sp. NPDC002227]|uniref:nucleotidyl transferase AbiEii/AbiGii toxin family protein n=1 Tax=Kitasatospora sp. NPDC002227 TaxID=3154773 RepID=UPI00331FD19A